MSLKENLKTYSATELKKFISSTNIKGYSKMTKDELINLMIKAEHKDKFGNIQAKVKQTKVKQAKVKKEPKTETKPKTEPKTETKPEKEDIFKDISKLNTFKPLLNYINTYINKLNNATSLKDKSKIKDEFKKDKNDKLYDLVFKLKDDEFIPIETIRKNLEKIFKIIDSIFSIGNDTRTIGIFGVDNNYNTSDTYNRMELDIRETINPIIKEINQKPIIKKYLKELFKLQIEKPREINRKSKIIFEIMIKDNIKNLPLFLLVGENFKNWNTLKNKIFTKKLFIDKYLKLDVRDLPSLYRSGFSSNSFR